MYRDFSESSKQKLLELVSEVEDENWCGFTDWFGDRWLDFESLIGTLNIKRYLNDIDTYHKKVIDKNNATKQSIESIFSNVRYVDLNYSKLFYDESNVINKIESYIQILCETISPSNGNFNSMIISTSLGVAFQEIQRALANIHFGGIVYNPNNNGYYGGDQGAPQHSSRSEIEEYRRIIEKNISDANMTDSQLRNYLAKINSEGCGYVALVNTIFCYYTDNPEEFEKTFGYPMYDDNGQLNYDMLLVDLYSRMDNRDSNGKFDPFNDYDPDSDGPQDKYDWRNDRHGSGTNQYEREYYLETFMEEHGIDVNVKTNVSITPENVDEYLKKGRHIIISFHDGNLYNMDGTVGQEIDGGHAMTVTGVTDNGMLIVSSWGRQYYIDPDEVLTLNYNGSEHKTSMTFSTVEYK